MNKKYYVLLGVIVVAIAILIGASYAFFMANVTGGDSGNETVIKSGSLNLTLADTNTITLNNSKPGDSASKEFTVTNTSKSTLLYNIKLVDVINTFVDKTDLVYTLVGDNNINVVLDIPSIIAQALQDQGGDSAGMAETIMAVLEQLQSATPAEIKAILANLLQNVGEGTILANLDLTQIADEDIAKLMDYLTNGFPLKYDITTPVLSDGETTVNDIYVYLDKEFMDILMPAVAPLLASPELETIVSGAVGQYWGLLKMLLGINSLADINDVWAVTSLFKVGLDLADGSFVVPEAETPAE